MKPLSSFYFGSSRILGTTFYCLENNEVNQILENSGTIKTLIQGDSNYRNNQKCSWFIEVGQDNNMKVQFTVTQNGLEWVPEDSICIGYDYIQIINGILLYSPSSTFSYNRVSF